MGFFNKLKGSAIKFILEKKTRTSIFEMVENTYLENQFDDPMLLSLKILSSLSVANSTFKESLLEERDVLGLSEQEIVDMVDRICRDVARKYLK